MARALHLQWRGHKFESYIQDLYEKGLLTNIVGKEWSLEDNLRDADIVRDKITGEGEDLTFE